MKTFFFWWSVAHDFSIKPIHSINLTWLTTIKVTSECSMCDEKNGRKENSTKFLINKWMEVATGQTWDNEPFLIHSSLENLFRLQGKHDDYDELKINFCANNEASDSIKKKKCAKNLHQTAKEFECGENRSTNKQTTKTWRHKSKYNLHTIYFLWCWSSSVHSMKQWNTRRKILSFFFFGFIYKKTFVLSSFTLVRCSFIFFFLKSFFCFLAAVCRISSLFFF